MKPGRLPQPVWQFAPLLAALAIGALVTFFVGVGFARLTQPPAIGFGWSILNDHFYNTFSMGPAEYFEDKPDSKWLALYQAEGYGFRVRDLRYYNADEVTPTSQPQHLRRRFVTDVGFPALALRTESSEIGRRFAIDHADNVRDDRIVSPSTRFHYVPLWRGFIVNTLLAAALLLAFYVFVRRKRCCFAPPTVVICACAALWLSMLIAWAAFWHQEGAGRMVFIQNPSEYAQHVKPLAPPADDEPWDNFNGTISRAFGSRIEDYYFSTTGVTDQGVMYAKTVPARGFRHRLGWPYFCLDTSEQTSRPPYTGARLDIMFRLPVAWPGLLANWVVYTLILLGLFLGPGWIRRRRRLKRGCCVECGYPRGTSPVCTECGSPPRGATRGSGIVVPTSSRRGEGSALSHN